MATWQWQHGNGNMGLTSLQYGHDAIFMSNIAMAK
jgi:hypothetical protein